MKATNYEVSAKVVLVGLIGLLLLALVLLSTQAKAQQYKYIAKVAKIGNYDDVAKSYVWEKINQVTIPVIFNPTTQTIDILAKEEVHLTWYSLYQDSETENTNTWVLECVNQEASYVVCIDQIPQNTDYTHMLYLNYTGYTVCYELSPM